MKFELVVKTNRREITTRCDDIESLLGDMHMQLAKARLPVGRMDEPPYSGARGELEVGIEGGPQILIRVL